MKHHVCNANLMRNGADFAVFINTGNTSAGEWGFFFNRRISSIVLVGVAHAAGRGGGIPEHR